MSVKPPSGVTNAPPVQASDPSSVKSAQPTITVPQVNPEALAQALKDFQKLKSRLKKPFMSGAAGLFTDNVVFPGDLLDTANPANDPKYLHLLSSVLGLKTLEDYFSEEEQREEDKDENEEEPENPKNAPKKQ